MVEEGRGVIVVGVGIGKGIDLGVVGYGGCIGCEVVGVGSRLSAPGDSARWT